MMIRSRIFSKEQIQFIVENYKGKPFQKLTEDFNFKFNTNFSKSKIQRFCGNHKLHNGVPGGRFKKGHKSWNKGTKGLTCANKTSFKKGQMPHNHRPVGAERITVDGYIEIKIAEPRTWKLKHVYIWEKVNGKVPPKHCLLFLDNNKQNISLDNLVLIKRAELARINQLGLNYEDAELTKSGIVIAKIVSKSCELKKSTR